MLELFNEKRDVEPQKFFGWCRAPNFQARLCVPPAHHTQLYYDDDYSSRTAFILSNEPRNTRAQLFRWACAYVAR